ncbi:MAG TPA: hypothetical protein VGG12_00150, partial [Methylovirgula sp.]
MASSDMDSSDTGSEKDLSTDPNATDSSDASSEETKASEMSHGTFSAKSPSEALAEAVQHGSHTRPGSSLILIPPVTRKTEGAHANPPPREEATGPGFGSFGAARASRFAADFRDKFDGKIFKDKWQRYAVPAALGFCLFGVGLATGGQFFGTANSSEQGKLAAVDTTEMRHATKKLNDEIHALQTRFDTMRSAPQSGSPDDIRSLKKSMDGLKASLDSIKMETTTQIAELNAKIDRLQHKDVKPSVASGNQPSATTNDTGTHASAQATNGSTIRPPSPGITGSIGHSGTTHTGDTQTALVGPPSPQDQMQPQPPAPDAKKKPQSVLVDWVVRDVYRGVALIDGPDGTIEVAKGDMIPGAGTVESIEHRNGGWVLVT